MLFFDAYTPCPRVVHSYECITLMRKSYAYKQYRKHQHAGDYQQQVHRTHDSIQKIFGKK